MSRSIILIAITAMILGCASEPQHTTSQYGGGYSSATNYQTANYVTPPQNYAVASPSKKQQTSSLCANTMLKRAGTGAILGLIVDCALFGCTPITSILSGAAAGAVEGGVECVINKN